MKELKLLAEDWKGEIDYSRAAVRVWSNGVAIAHQARERSEGCKYYKIVRGELEELRPLPRPADSIKLSECDGKHVITVDNSRGSNRRITYETHREKSCWYVMDFDGKWHQRFSCLVKLVEEMKLTNIKIYDMSQ